MVIKIRNPNFILLLIVLIESCLIVNSIVADSYLVSRTNPIFENAVVGEKDNFSGKTLGVLIGFFMVKQIGIVSAQNDVTWNCCTKTKDGAICQDTASFDDESCAVEKIPAKCSEVAECKMGCCVDEKEGLCTTRATKKTCEDSEGKWEDSEECLVKECQKGCCGLGNNFAFVTEERCEKLSLFNGVSKDFRDYQTEIACIALKEIQDEGACILKLGFGEAIEENNKEKQKCVKTTELDCSQKGGEFHKNYLCSNPTLETGCEKQKTIGCVEGKDEIYWFDSCGNRENIYNSDKDKSWNNGMVLKKSESCNPSSGNIESSDCGNCNYYVGSTCSSSNVKKVKDGNFICKDLRCIDENGNVRQNGESWCVYDSYIGDGKDTVGSRHWRRMCIDGEVKVEPCADYRGQICVQSSIKHGGKEFTTATCAVNEALKCISYNSKKNMKQLCERNKDCMIQSVDVSETFKFDICTGRYPRGFDVSGKQRAETSAQLCAIANQECTAVYVKHMGGWACEANCECEKEKFAREMNDLCISMGDCGSYVNYIGDGTDNIKVENAPSISWEKYKSFAEKVQGQFAKPKDIRESLANFGVKYNSLNPGENPLATTLSIIGGVMGGAGLILYGYGYLFGTSTILYQATPEAIKLATLAGEEIVVSSGTETSGVFATGGLGPELTAVSNAFMSAGIISLAGTLISMAFGLEGEAGLIMAAVSTTASVGVFAVSLFLEKTGGLCFLYPIGTIICVIIIIIMIIIAALLKIFKIGDIKEVKVKFTCMPWQPPIGGANCGKCNDDPLKPCTDYRCSSLGTACYLVDTHLENPKCEAIPNDYKPPIISYGEINQGFYKFIEKGKDKVELRTSEGECIPEFTTVLFTLITNEPAQCRFDFTRKAKFNELEQYFVEQNSFSTNHSSGFMVPSLSALSVYDVNGSLFNKTGEIEMFVKCRDIHGNENIKDYIVNFCVGKGPDLTPPAVVKTIPSSGGMLEYGTSETNLTVYLNEPAECRYSQKDVEYNFMENNMSCETELANYGNYGWECLTKLANLTQNKNIFYIKCKDQPWLEKKNQSELGNLTRNVNTESYPYEIIVSQKQLKISSIKPDGVIQEGFQPINVNLEVKTEGGVEEGVAECEYSFEGNDSEMMQFKDTFSNIHKQNFNMIINGEYEIFIICKDKAGNIAEGETKFSVITDTQAPIITRIYREDTKLIINTNEDAICYYNKDTCLIDVKNSTAISGGNSKKHYFNSDLNSKYYIKCEDVWGNVNPECFVASPLKL